VPRLAKALVGALLIGSLCTAPAWAAERACGTSDYSYAGLQGVRRSHGVRATLTPLAAPHVLAGHVAAWVGVGWAGGGPNGQDEWIQAGMAAEPDDPAARLYYEVVKPGAPYTYRELRDVAPGQRHRLSVLEMEHRRGWWRVWVDGTPVSEPVFLPGSHGAWEPVATAESWNGGVGACNRLAFRFEQVGWSQRAGGWWHRLSGGYRFADPGYRIVRRAAATFLTLSRELVA
jgi:hypothetical protein